MAAPAVRAAAWVAAALAAGGALLALALHGERPEAGLTRYQPAGVMLALAPERAAAVEVARAGRRWRFERGSGGWAAVPPGAPGGPRPDALLDLGLRLLHGSAPQRVMEGEDLRGLVLPELGLEPPWLSVRVEAPGVPVFAVDIGAPNPQGLARYARVAGRPEVFLLNHYVADPWASLTEDP